METELTTSPTKAAAVLRRGELVAFPTETVYGLGADAFQPEAVRSIFGAKGRPTDNPLIVHVCRRHQILQVANRLPDVGKQLLDAFAPGPITLILPKHPDLPSVVTAGLDTVGVRMPRHSTAQAFLEACETPVPAPSANRSGRPSPTTWQAVREDLDGRIACIVKGGRTERGIESTVVDCTASPPVVLRPGAVSLEALRDVAGPLRTSDDGEERTRRSPGTRHRHYAPAARVRLVDAPEEAEAGPDVAYIGLDAPADPDAFGELHVLSDVQAYAHALFHVFRQCDNAGCRVIYAQTVSPEGMGRALNDRLRRAAAR